MVTDFTEIDINCDVGEGLDNEGQLMPLISSCNIACGGHAGDRASMTKVIGLAKQNHVRIGAHPSYPDKENFGRVSIPISDTKLIESIERQINDLKHIAEEEKVQIHHIKAHGALYNDMAKSESLSKVFLEAVKAFRSETFLYVPYASAIAKIALQKNFKLRYEAFADRNYNEDLSLVPRNKNEALIHSPEQVLEHILGMLAHNRVRTIEGRFVKILADTFCIHGDNILAFEIVSYLTKALPDHNIHIKK
ncbi:5-oxoprolinase subunit PxpA [Pareuzebyella sediminis]|uniref:5-oxoprolinase subunit PxpA n=1 Tax=Pareuzebyella sediminis TaxID=2607998 RepID=UPI0011EE6CF7|nr:5-oxoprolinase subunit PxpA [Pareuzebyella sediminis]